VPQAVATHRRHKEGGAIADDKISEVASGCGAARRPLPMLDHLRRLVIKRRFATALVAVGAARFTAVWVIAGVVLIGAAFYQFGPLKVRCSRACRSPRGFTLAHWRGRRPALVETITITGA